MKRDWPLNLIFWLHPTLPFLYIRTHVSTPGLALSSQCPSLQQQRRVQQGKRSMADKRRSLAASFLLSLAVCSAPAASAVLSPVLGDGRWFAFVFSALLRLSGRVWISRRLGYFTRRQEMTYFDACFPFDFLFYPLCTCKYFIMYQFLVSSKSRFY